MYSTVFTVGLVGQLLSSIVMLSPFSYCFARYLLSALLILSLKLLSAARAALSLFWLSALA
jgi:hypothetical protein